MPHFLRHSVIDTVLSGGLGIDFHTHPDIHCTVQNVFFILKKRKIPEIFLFEAFCYFSKLSRLDRTAG